MAINGAKKDTITGDWPTGHFGWVFQEPSQFEGRAATFLAQGLERNERLMFIADDPQPRHWPARLLDSGVLQIASITDVYGSQRIVDAKGQRSAFATVLAEALGQGFSGIRVAADNTSLIATPERLVAWSEWEAEGDRFMAENPVTGMCGFDLSEADPDNVIQIVGLHAVLVSSN